MDADIASAGAGPHSRDFDLLLQYCAASSAPIARDMESFHRQGAFIFAGETVPKVGYLAFLNYLERILSGRIPDHVPRAVSRAAP